MTRFMTKNQHAADRACAAADDSQKQQRSFSGSSCVVTRLTLVCAHSDKGDKIDQCEVKQSVLQQRHFRFPLPGLVVFFALGFAQPALYSPFFGLGGSGGADFFF